MSQVAQQSTPITWTTFSSQSGPTTWLSSDPHDIMVELPINTAKNQPLEQLLPQLPTTNYIQFLSSNGKSPEIVARTLLNLFEVFTRQHKNLGLDPYSTSENLVASCRVLEQISPESVDYKTATAFFDATHKALEELANTDGVSGGTKTVFTEAQTKLAHWARRCAEHYLKEQVQKGAPTR